MDAPTLVCRRRAPCDCIARRRGGTQTIHPATRPPRETDRGRRPSEMVQSETIIRNQRQSEAVSGTQRGAEETEGIGRQQRPSVAIRGTQRPSEAIRGHQWPSVAIRGNQWGDLITIEKHGRVQRAGGVASRLSHILGASVWPAQRWRETSMTVSTRARPTLGWSSEGSRACVDLCRSETRTLVRSHTARLREVKCLIMRLYLLEANWLSGRCTNSELSRHTSYDNPGCV